MGVGAIAIGVAICAGVSHTRRKRLILQGGEIFELMSVWTDVDGCLLHGRMSKAAPCDSLPVVMIHGWGISGSYFLPTAERLAADFSVYVPDLPGHGRSETPPQTLSIQDLARALLRWMDALGIGRASLIGHSMGCQIAVEAALQALSRIDRLVLIGPALDPSARSTPRLFRRFLSTGLHERPSLSAHLIRDYARMGKRLVPEYRSMLNERLEKKLVKITVPTMLVRGEKDRIVPQPWIEEAARLLRTGKIVVIPSWGHAVQYNAPGELIQAIAPFLRQGYGEEREQIKD